MFYAWYDIPPGETIGEPVTFHFKTNAHIVASFLFASSVGLLFAAIPLVDDHSFTTDRRLVWGRRNDSPQLPIAHAHL